MNLEGRRFVGLLLYNQPKESMSRFIYILPILLLFSCQTGSAEEIILKGTVKAEGLDSIFLYQRSGLEQVVIASVPLKQRGDSATFSTRLDSIPQGWYTLGQSPNQLTEVLLYPGEETLISGVVGANLLYLKPPAAQSHWARSAQEYYVKSQAVNATAKMALMSMDNGDQGAYADYTNLTMTEYSQLLIWLDSLTASNPFLAREFDLRLAPPFLPAFGTFTSEAAFETRDTYWQALLDQMGESAARYPGFYTGFEEWMELQNREEAWAAPELRAQRIKGLLGKSSPGMLLHQTILASAISVLDGWSDIELIPFAKQYLELYPGNRRMESFLQGRIRLLEEKKRYETVAPRLYGQ